MDTFARQGLRFGLSLILARLLTPDEYGTVALLTVLVGLAGIFIDSGFSWALIQRKEITDLDISSVFYFNLAVSIICAGLLSLAAPWIAGFYHIPVLRPLAYVLALNIVLGAFGTVQGILLSRELAFRRQCIITIVSLTLSGSAAVFLAYRNYGVWSLVIQSLVGSIVSASLLWFSSTWRPAFIFSIRSIRSLFGFSAYLLLSNILEVIYSRLNTLVIGKMYSAREVGIYSRADSTSILPGSVLSGILGRVSYPLFARAQDDKTLLQTGLRKAIMLVMMVNIPLMAGIAITARPLITLLYGDQWLASVPFLQILSLAGILWPLHLLNLNVLGAQGHSKLVFRLEIIKKIIGLGVLGTACLFGLTAIAWSSIVMGIVSFGINAHYSGQFLNYGAWRQAGDILPYACAAAVMALCVKFAGMPFTAPLYQLIAQVATGVGVYLLICASLRLRAFVDSWRMIQPMLPNPIARICT